ncbi:host attachment protein [Thiobacter aerophilum]|uniref:Host attachment protein n=1 Tax=Thiobacter aerophilum TaxID=3121275 RepID=A0ABV0EBG6_9BURK
MSMTWVVVANASIARIYERNKGLHPVTELTHPQSRMKRADLVTDRPGYMQSVGNGHGSRQPATDPKTHEAEEFALEIAKLLDHERAAGKFNRLVLVASTPFMGMLKQRLHAQTAELVTDTIEKDYTKASEKELVERLKEQIVI